MTNWTEADLKQLRERSAQPTPKARGVIRPPGFANKTEEQYAAHLAVEYRIGTVLWWRYGAVTLKLADDTRYTPDFMVLTADTQEIQFHETKGYWRDDAKVKIKVAAEMYPLFRFVAVYKEAGGGWRLEQF